MEPPWQVRTIRADEFDRLKEIRLRALADTPMAFGSTYEREAAFPQSAWQDRAAGGSAGGDRVTFIAERDGEWVGLATGVRGEKDGEFQLVGMFVDRVARGTGLAIQLIESIAEWAVGRGGSRLALWVTSINEPAIGRYTRCGFLATGETEPLPHTPALTEMRMVRELTSG